MPLSCLKSLILWIGCGVNSVLRMRFCTFAGYFREITPQLFEEVRGRILKLQV